MVCDTGDDAKHRIRHYEARQLVKLAFQATDYQLLRAQSPSVIKDGRLKHPRTQPEQRNTTSHTHQQRAKDRIQTPAPNRPTSPSDR